MGNTYTAPKYFGANGKFNDLRNFYNSCQSERTALERLIRYKQDKTIYDIDNNFTSRKKHIFKPIADLYKILWDIDVVVNSKELLNSGETIVASSYALGRSKPNIPHKKRGGYFSVKWEELADDKYLSDKEIQDFAHAVATIGNFMPVPGAEQKMLTFLEERFDRELKIIKSYYCSNNMEDSLPSTICKWLDLSGKGEEGWKKFVDSNFLAGSFVDKKYNVVCFDNTLSQLTEMINERSKSMLDEYSKRWKEIS